MTAHDRLRVVLLLGLLLAAGILANAAAVLSHGFSGAFENFRITELSRPHRVRDVERLLRQRPDGGAASTPSLSNVAACVRDAGPSVCCVRCVGPSWAFPPTDLIAPSSSVTRQDEAARSFLEIASVTTRTLKLGKTPARPGAVTFRLADYISKTALPKPPKSFGHEDLVKSDWGMLGNDQYGDCVWAGAAHETVMWNAEAGHAVSFNATSVLSDYSAVTGFNPHKPDTDQGTDMQAAASYRRKTGVVDAAGHRHKIAAYLAIKPGDVTELYQAMYLFGAVGIGIRFPSSAMDQFNAGKAWSVVKGASIEGGHYIPFVAKRTKLVCVTWGRLQPLTAGFFDKYCDEALAYVSEEALTHNKSPEGFDAAALLADLKAL